MKFAELSPTAKETAIADRINANLEIGNWANDLEENMIFPFLRMLGFHGDLAVDWSVDVSHHNYASFAHAHAFSYPTGMKYDIQKYFSKHHQAIEISDKIFNLSKKYFYSYRFSLRGGNINDLEHYRFGNSFRHDTQPYEDAMKSIINDINAFLLSLYQTAYENACKVDESEMIDLDDSYSENGKIC